MKRKDMRGIVVVRATYPSGRAFYQVRCDGDVVGAVDAGDGGYTPGGARKPSLTLREAVERLVSRRIERLRKEADRLEMARAAGFAPATEDASDAES